MRKTKEQKGITLVALIITIIVLLILAVVAIGAVTNDGIINHAKNARTEYVAEQEKENTTLGNYLDKIKENAPQTENEEETPGDSGDNTGGNQGTTITFTIGGKQYTAAAGMTWEQWIKSTDYDSDDIKCFASFVGWPANESTKAIGTYPPDSGLTTYDLVEPDDPIVANENYSAIWI